MPASQPDRTSPQAVAEDSSASELEARRDLASNSGTGVSLDQFRQVLEDQRRQTAQLQSLLESRFASDERGGGAADKVETLVSKIETLASRIDSIGNTGNGAAGHEKQGVPPQVNGLMLRVGELERKISEATPEPLLKEIVFRLGSLEDAVGQSPDGGGIGEVRERVKALERQKAQRSSPDPRVDELTARLAAVESAARASEDLHGGEVLARLHSLEEHAGGSASMARLEELNEHIESLRAAFEGGSRDGLAKIEERLATIESSAAGEGGRVDDAGLIDLGAKVEALTGVAERLQSLELKVAEAKSSDVTPELAARLDLVESWSERLAAVEDKASASAPRIAEISARLERLDALDSLTERIGKVEEQAATSPRDPRYEGIEARLNSLEEIGARVAVLEAKTAEPPADPRVDEIKARLGAMSDVAHIGDVESRVSSLTTRLDALKMITDGLKATHKPGLGDAGPRVDALAAQLAELKASLAARGESADGAEAPSWDELLKRIERIEKDGTPTAHDPRFTELAVRLASLEKPEAGGSDPRVTEILARLSTMEQPAFAPAEATLPPELIARIESVEKRLSGAAANGKDPLVAQLRERWEILEERMMRFEESMAEADSGEGDQTGDDLRAKVAELGGKLDALRAGEAAEGFDPQTVATLRELAKSGPPTGGGFELGTVKSQMTFVYFSIGMLYAICAYAGYVMLSSH